MGFNIGSVVSNAVNTVKNAVQDVAQKVGGGGEGGCCGAGCEKPSDNEAVRSWQGQDGYSGQQGVQARDLLYRPDQDKPVITNIDTRGSQSTTTGDAQWI